MLVLSTPRIRQLMRLLLNGFSTNKDLAEGMNCSPRTIKSYISKMAKDNKIDPDRYVVLARLIYLYYEEKTEIMRAKREGATLEPITTTGIEISPLSQMERSGRRIRDVRRSPYPFYDEDVRS